MDLNQLAVFVEVVSLGSFTAAANALGLSKSTVSRKVTDLESRLGTQLIQRTTRELRSTDIGAAYYQRAVKIVEAARAAEDLVGDLQQEPCGTLRVTVPMTFAFLGPIIGEYLDRHPGVNAEMLCTDRVVDLLAEGFDVAVRAGRLVDSTLIARRVGSVRRFLVAAPEYLKRHGGPGSPAELGEHDTLYFTGGGEGSSTWTLRSATEEVEVDLKPRLRADDYDMLLGVARAGLGVALLPDYLCQKGDSGGVRRVLPEWEAPVIPLHAVFYGGRTSKKVLAFLDLLKERLSGARAG